MCSTRIIHVCNEVQRAINSYLRRGWIFTKAATGLQVRAGPQHYGRTRAAVILAWPDVSVSTTTFTLNSISTPGIGLLINILCQIYISIKLFLVCVMNCCFATNNCSVYMRGRFSLSDFKVPLVDWVKCCLHKWVYYIFMTTVLIMLCRAEFQP